MEETDPNPVVVERALSVVKRATLAVNVLREDQEEVVVVHASSVEKKATQKETARRLPSRLVTSAGRKDTSAETVLKEAVAVVEPVSIAGRRVIPNVTAQQLLRCLASNVGKRVT